MNIIDKAPLKDPTLRLLDTKQNVLYRGEQSKRIYLGVRVYNSDSAYLAELGEGVLCWNGNCPNDTTFVAVEADLVIKN